MADQTLQFKNPGASMLLDDLLSFGGAVLLGGLGALLVFGIDIQTAVTGLGLRRGVAALAGFAGVFLVYHSLHRVVRVERIKRDQSRLDRLIKSRNARPSAAAEQRVKAVLEKRYGR